MQTHWHYLVVSAANDAQAAAYESQLRHRKGAGPLAHVDEVIVIADAGGLRIGSGGSTLQCLLHILNHGQAARGPLASFEQAEQILSGLRILIVHAGGDSRRLPAYSACGKLFVPLPGASDTAQAPALFDRLVSSFLRLPSGPAGSGQVVVASGDALLSFSPATVDFSAPGVTALAARATPLEASRHGVFRTGRSGGLRLYLQKPGLEEQVSAGALGAAGHALLDVGVMSFSPTAAGALLRAFCQVSAGLFLRPHLDKLIFAHGLDLYREICCALGSDATRERFIRSARASGSRWRDGDLAALFPLLTAIPMHVRVLEPCRFLHFGSTLQLITSGLALAQQDTGVAPDHGLLVLNSLVAAGGAIRGNDSWVEGCRVHAALTLDGRNVVVGVDIREPLHLPRGGCLDVSRGLDRRGQEVWFMRCYGVEDSFKHSIAAQATFNGVALDAWLHQAGVAQSEVWDAGVPATERTLWNARVFPAEQAPGAYRRWLWMFEPRQATAEQKSAFLQAGRYSAAEIALLASQEHYQFARQSIRAALPGGK